MQNKKNIIYLLSLSIDVLIVVCVIYGLYTYCHDSIENIITGVHGVFDENSFSYFTTLSNILCLITSLIGIPYLVASLFRKNSNWIVMRYLRLVSTVFIVITFLIVNLVLVWIVDNPYQLYEGKELFTHVLVPIFCVCNFFLSDFRYGLSIRLIAYVNFPVFIYSILYLIFVFVLEKWSDFYSIGFWYPYSIVIFVFIFFSLTIALTILFIKLKSKDKGKMNENSKL